MDQIVEKNTKNALNNEDLSKTIDAFNNYAETKSLDFSQYGATIISLGESPQMAVAFLQAVKPRRALFICTNESRKRISDVYSHIQPYWEMPVQTIEIAEVSGIDTAQIHSEINRFIKSCREGGISGPILFDITGGKKSMSAAVAMAAAVIPKCITFYLDTPMGRIPGTEIPLRLENPYPLFAELEIVRVKELFRRLDFAGAMDLLNTTMASGVRNLDHIRDLSEIAQSLSRIEEFNYSETARALNDITRHFNGKKIDHLNDIYAYLSVQNDAAYPVLNLCFIYCTALRWMARKKYDVAVLVYYRTLESLEQNLLAECNIDTGYVDWNNVEDEVKKKYIEMNRGNNDGDARGTEDAVLPSKISLVSGFILLLSLKQCSQDDAVKELLATVTFLDTSWLSQLRNYSQYRNRSIFAHGQQPVSEDECSEIKDFVRSSILSYVNIRLHKKLPENNPYHRLEQLEDILSLLWIVEDCIVFR